MIAAVNPSIPGLRPQDHAAILTIASRHPIAQLILFGSRARATPHDVSDIDLATRMQPSAGPLAFSDFRDDLQDSLIPFRLDVLDLSRLTNLDLLERIAVDGIDLLLPYPIATTNR